MKLYLVTLGAGLVVGIFYGVLHVRSPAPPVVALVGLLGILLGEQVPPLVRRVADSLPITSAWVRKQCGEHVFGNLPTSASAALAAATAAARQRRDPGTQG